MSFVKAIVLERSNKSIELLLLISLSAFLDNNRSSKMLKKFCTEDCHCFRLMFTSETLIYSLTLVIDSIIFAKVTNKFLSLALEYLI